ncbi:exopolysaccharide biosynthesis polyprenyl glycosylphosphotransferase [Halomonas stenophila]|uniref:Lipopolysaccharide/colanic/teichoic acid biosynthesis glycosyltransferase n=1 Tax=Halomonas stenophila TaxID=795312 RepID=A0A7W5HI52_9GAMM|nr:exopolysaccharide biosynthesis polyprenyl glycosylphosphotransferase [Halomonas stenophila]MBB3229555.1 lipopolysaccharide/colanic/teichoic acid biosynthesis glycosyltransferase [Halomonas stenophila]
MVTVTTVFPGQGWQARLVKRLLNNDKLQLWLGLAFAVLLPSLVSRESLLWQTAGPTQWLTFLLTTLAYWCSMTTVQRMGRLPGTCVHRLSIPVTSVCFAIPYAVVLFLERELLDELYLAGYLLTMLYGTAGYRIGRHYRVLKLGVVPFGKAPSLCQNHGVEWHSLGTPELGNVGIDGVVADLYDDLPPEWERFLADCTLHRLPVYHATTTLEWLTGRVQLGYLYENRYGSLRPDEGYEMLKRCLDLLTVLATLPLTLPLMVITAIAIRLESRGAVLFTQQRMGFQCRPFTVYKFRSMYTHQQGNGYTEDSEDPRITRVGKVIRKYRVDELPQLFNVLKGDMSLIGPRPESMDLASWYQKDVPFFHYRHVVRPGISGWAQVEQGYAAEVDGMNRKLEYDFYYIKNISFWLDLLIVLRTIRTVLTGFGSR